MPTPQTLASFVAHTKRVKEAFALLPGREYGTDMLPVAQFYRAGQTICLSQASMMSSSEALRMTRSGILGFQASEVCLVPDGYCHMPSLKTIRNLERGSLHNLFKQNNPDVKECLTILYCTRDGSALSEMLPYSISGTSVSWLSPDDFCQRDDNSVMMLDFIHAFYKETIPPFQCWNKNHREQGYLDQMTFKCLSAMGCYIATSTDLKEGGASLARELMEQLSEIDSDQQELKS